MADSFSAGLTGAYNTMRQDADRQMGQMAQAQQMANTHQKIKWEREDREIAQRQREAANALMALRDGDESVFNSYDWDGVKLHKGRDGSFTAVGGDGQPISGQMSSEQASARLYKYMDPSVLRSIRSDQQAQANADRTFAEGQRQFGLNYDAGREDARNTKDYQDKTLKFKEKELAQNKEYQREKLKIDRMLADETIDHHAATEQLERLKIAATEKIEKIKNARELLKRTQPSNSDIREMAELVATSYDPEQGKTAVNGQVATAFMAAVNKLVDAGADPQTAASRVLERFSAGMSAGDGGSGGTAGPKGMPSPTGGSTGKVPYKGTTPEDLPAPERKIGEQFVDADGTVWKMGRGRGGRPQKMIVMRKPPTNRPTNGGRGLPRTNPDWIKYLSLLDEVNGTKGLPR